MACLCYLIILFRRPIFNRAHSVVGVTALTLGGTMSIVMSVTWFVHLHAYMYVYMYVYVHVCLFVVSV